MKRFDPISRVSEYATHIGDMTPHKTGNWVSYDEANEIEKDYMAIARECDGHDCAECVINVRKWKTDLAACRTAITNLLDDFIDGGGNSKYSVPEALDVLRNTQPLNR